MSEYDEQCALFEWAERMQGRLPVLRLLHHVPNGERRDKITGARLKRAGVKRGVPDIFLPCASVYAGKSWHGLYIEMKSTRGRQTKEQREWAALLTEQGYFVHLTFDWWLAACKIVGYLGQKPADFGL